MGVGRRAVHSRDEAPGSGESDPCRGTKPGGFFRARRRLDLQRLHEKRGTSRLRVRPEKSPGRGLPLRNAPLPGRPWRGPDEGC